MNKKSKDAVFFSLPQEEHNLMNNKQMVIRAKGPYVWMKDEDKPYIDFVMGYSAANFGHLNDDVLSTFDNLTSDNVVFFNNIEKESLVNELGDALGLKGKWNFYFPVGGAMAVEAAARACLLAKPGGVLLGFKGSFHGYGGVSRVLTDTGFLLQDVFMDPTKKIESLRPIDTGSVQSALELFEKDLKNNNVAGVFIEPVQGAAGFIDLGAEFLQGVRKVCTKYEVPLVCDEIQAAMFRCGKLSVCLSRDITPDVLLMGKSLGGGVVPVSAVIMSSDFAKKVPLGHAAFDSTFSGWTVGVSTARNVIKLVSRNNFEADVERKGKLADLIFDEELGNTDLRKTIRRVGLAIAFDGDSPDQSEAVRVEALNRHVIIQTTGVDGSKCKISPAITIPDDIFKTGIREFAQSIKKVCS